MLKRLHIAAVVLVGLLAGCHTQIAPVPAKPDFTPIKAAASLADTSARETLTHATAVVTVLQEHVADTQPAHVVVAEVMPAAAATTQSAAITVERVAAIAPAVAPVEKQTTAVYTSAVQNHDAAVEYKDDLHKEQNSWFGGKLGHILRDVVIAVMIGGAAWLISKILLAGASGGIAGLGLLSDLGTPFHIVGNVIEATLSVIGWAFKQAAAGLQWFWDEVILKHVPYPPAPPTANPTAKPNP